jgi:hypothetical protein
MVSLPTRGTSFRFNGFLDHQTHGPTSAALGGIATHQGNNPLLLAVVKHGGRAGALFFEQGGVKAARLIAMANGANGLGG